MKTKTKQQIETEVSNYLNKTSKHLFVTESGYYYKIITFKRNEKEYYATLLFNNDNFQINDQEIVSDNYYNYYGNNTTNMIKHMLFPEYYKTKSIPFFKKMKNLIKEIEQEITSDNTTNKALIDKFKTKIVELQLIN